MDAALAGISPDMVRATHEFTLYESEGWTAARYGYADKKGTFIACGYLLPDVAHVTAKLTGRWENSARHGKRFRVDYSELEMPVTEEGIISYLKSLKVGIGKKRAKNIYDKFGAEVWNVLKTEPDKLAEGGGLPSKTLDKLIGRLKENRLMRDLASLLGSCADITPRKVSELIKAFGPDALYTVKTDTYALCGVRGFSFPAVDKMAKAMGQDPAGDKRLFASMKYLFDEAAAAGNVCVPKAEYLENMTNLLNAGYAEKVVTPKICGDALNRAWMRGTVKTSGRMIYDRDRYDQEVSIKDSLARLMGCAAQTVKDADAMIRLYGAETGFEMSESQMRAVLNVMNFQVNIITGGPGTGKTTIIRAVLAVHAQAFGKNSLPVLLAPTGRAARRMSDATGFPASTIHSALGCRGDCDEWNRYGGRTLEGNLFIVDEASMVDQYIAAILLQSIPDGSKVVFVGDADQLPSVGCGNVLCDMVRSGVIPTTRLDVIFRQEKDNPIVANSRRVNAGGTDLQWTDTFRFYPCETWTEIFRKAASLYVKCVRAYGADNVLLLCPFRSKSRLNVNMFNLNLQNKLNPLKPGDLSIKAGNIEFRAGDRIMQTKNTDNAKNGDIGYIREITRTPDPDDPGKWRYSALAEFNGDGNVLEYGREELADCDLAYCTTVHKSQGSEYEIVIMVVSDEHAFALRRNLVYTAITRAVRCVAVVGGLDVLKRAILNDKTDVRHTLLAERLRSEFDPQK